MLEKIQPGRRAITEHFVDFGNEERAEQYVFDSLAPYCEKIERQVRFKNGQRPDIGFRLKALPQVPLLVECKNFKAGKGLISTLVEAIAQASSYAELTRKAVFIAPLFGQGITQLDWIHSPVGIALLVAAHFNVGVLLFTPPKPRYPTDGIGSLLLGGQAIATLTIDEYGDPHTTLHSNAEHLLKFKSRFGSLSSRTSG
jgi:hypothetical protein